MKSSIIAALIVLLALATVAVQAEHEMVDVALVDSLEAEMYDLPPSAFVLTKFEQNMYDQMKAEEEQALLESESEMDAEAETEADAEADAELDSETDVDADAELDAESESESEAEAESEQVPSADATLVATVAANVPAAPVTDAATATPTTPATTTGTDESTAPKKELVKPTIEKGTVGLPRPVKKPRNKSLDALAPCPAEEKKKKAAAFLEIESEIEEEPATATPTATVPTGTDESTAPKKELVKPTIEKGTIGLPRPAKKPRDKKLDALQPCPEEKKKKAASLLEVESEEEPATATPTAVVPTGTDESTAPKKELVKPTIEKGTVGLPRPAKKPRDKTLASLQPCPAEPKKKKDTSLLEVESEEAPAPAAAPAPTSPGARKIHIHVNTKLHGGANSDNLERIEQRFDGLHDRVMGKLNKLMSRIERHPDSIEDKEASYAFSA
jgi:hypothetical protein